VTRAERSWGVPTVRPSTGCSSPLGWAPNVDVMPTNQSPTRRFTGYSTGRLVLLSLTLTTVLAATAACVDNQLAGGGSSSTPPAASNASAATPTTSSATPTPAPATPTSQETHPVTTLRITVGDQTVTAELNDTPTAQDLARQLPLTITLDDFNNVEKVGELPQPLTMDGVPAGADPEINDIGYYQPSNGLVFYYGDVGYFNGIVRIGSLSAANMELIRSQTGNFTINIEEA
jgi:hypothetical protein